MNNKQVAHLWANKSRESASGSHFYFRGDTIYSYGGHFPIARHVTFKGNPVVLFTTADYSSSTARHKSVTLGAIASGIDIYHVKDVMSTKIAQCVKEGEKRAKERAESYAQSETRRIKRDLSKLAKFPELLAKWREHDPKVRSLPNLHGVSVALRLSTDGSCIETSHGAMIAARAAKHAWPILKKAVVDNSTLNIPEFDWGNFKGMAFHRDNSIIDNSEGNYSLRVGCHTIPFSEVEYIAGKLGL